MTEDEAAVRRRKVLEAARWCFLNFGFAKSSFEDIAKRAGISRTLLYRIFDDKEDLFRAVFTHWLIARHPAAQAAADAAGDPYERLVEVCTELVVEPWRDMVAAPMGAEFFDVCAKLDPEIEARHRGVVLACATKLVGDARKGEVFVLALDGLLADEPSPEVLLERVHVLAGSFVARAPRRARAAPRKGRKP